MAAWPGGRRRTPAASDLWRLSSAGWHTGSEGSQVMARKVEVHLLDDIDGGWADETVRFGLDRKSVV